MNGGRLGLTAQGETSCKEVAHFNSVQCFKNSSFLYLFMLFCSIDLYKAVVFIVV